jgi:hypothetical protein
MKQGFLGASIKWFVLLLACAGAMHAQAQTEDLVWTGLANTTVSGTTLQKTGGCDGCLDAGAISQQQLASGDGYVEITVSETHLVRYFGLSPEGRNLIGPTEIPFAIRIVSGYGEVKENGQYRADVPVVTGDVLRIAVQAGTVSYAKNGSVFHISAAAPGYPFVGEFGIHQYGWDLDECAGFFYWRQQFKLVLIQFQLKQ